MDNDINQSNPENSRNVYQSMKASSCLLWKNESPVNFRFSASQRFGIFKLALWMGAVNVFVDTACEQLQKPKMLFKVANMHRFFTP